MRRARLNALLVLAAALLLRPAPAPAAALQVDRFVFDREVDAAGTPLALAGAGLFRWKWVFKVYEVAHYLPPGAAPAAGGDVARRLEFAYHASIAAADFGRAADELLARNLPPAALAPLAARLERLHAAYVDVSPGDRYALTYLPGRGTELTFNGRRLALVEGADFARAYFSIWLGAQPIDAGLRDQLLGR